MSSLRRRNTHRNDPLTGLLRQVEHRFAGTPLVAIGDILKVAIFQTQCSTQQGTGSRDDIERIARYVSAVLNCLPDSFGDRFAFDAQLISALALECPVATGMLVPKPAKEWGHHSVAMPSIDGQSAHVVDVIHVPGTDHIDDIDLLDYPFLCHELGHNILFRNGDAFIRDFSQELGTVLSSFQRHTLGIQGSAKRIANDTNNQIREFWAPTANQYNWAHEIAVDIISLWLCGPAYLAAFQDVLQADDLDPHQLGQSHPPYELRTRALIEAAERLDWAYYTGEMQALLNRWSPSRKPKSNLHVACYDHRLVAGAISASMQLCGHLALPKCTPTHVTAIESKLQRQELPELGIELIVAAWLIRNTTTEPDYNTWEQQVISRLLAIIE